MLVTEGAPVCHLAVCTCWQLILETRQLCKIMQNSTASRSIKAITSCASAWRSFEGAAPLIIGSLVCPPTTT